MKKKIALLITIICVLCFAKPVKAASISISSSSKYPTVGSSITIRVNTNGLIGKFSITSSNPSIISGGTLGDWIEGGASSYQFKAKAVGTATITVVALDAADGNGNQISASNAITITVGEPVQKSSNNYLSSLTVEGANLNPAFKKDTLSYTTELAAGTTKAVIGATKEDSKASVEGIGEVELEEGDNTFEVKVIAENGSARVYSLHIVVKEFDPIEVKVGNKKYTVVRNVKKITPPTDYKETTIKINGEEVPAFKNKITKYVLVVLKDNKGNQNFYVYENGKFTKYEEYTFSKVILYPLEFKKIPSGYHKSKIKLNNSEVVAYKTKNSSNYALIYGMNVTTGKKHIYMYDKEEGTLQIYNPEFNDISNKLQQCKIIILALGGFSVVLLLICLVMTIKNHNKKNKTKKRKKKVKSNSLDEE